MKLFTCKFYEIYAMNSKKFAKITNETYKNGADIIYIVDSAGGMMPKEIYNITKRYEK